MKPSRLLLAIFPLVVLPVFACASGDGSDGASAGDPSQDDVNAWNESAAENASGKADNAGCSGVVIPDRKGFNHRIALTFDDGPNLVNTPKVLEILAKHNAKGTFFQNGKGLKTEETRAFARQMIAQGHIIGNHSQNHLNLKTVSASTLKTEIEQTLEIQRTLGQEPDFFRFPFGSAGCAQTETVRSYGYHVTGWHIDSADWCYAAPKGGVGYCHPDTFKYVPDEYRSDIVGFAVSQAKTTGGGVMLFHDIHAYTVSRLDDILTALESAGFTFVRLDDTDAFPLLNGGTAKSEPWIGTPCNADTTCTYTVTGATGFCSTYANGGFCSLACEGYCPDKAGTMRTFCTSLDGTTGVCVAKAGVENHDCTDIPGTTPTTVDRFIGTSTATAGSASVCLPN